ncbi:MAG: T9SS type A sorting domain-containing protein [Aureispira sp.]|nr:T9SS type A sorting domain-containing protein [Aureispira sp.]
MNNNGTLFEYDPITNTCTKKHDFVGGSWNRSALMAATNGKVYGASYAGGVNGNGVIYEYDPTTNTTTDKYNFTQAYSNPNTTLVQASNGKLYGTTSSGGTNFLGVIYEYDIVTGTCTKKYDFSNNTPDGDLIEGTNGKLYGAISNGGTTGQGILYEYNITTTTYTKKHDFGGVTGQVPLKFLVKDSNGKLYGVTTGGGLNNEGVLFEYSPTTGIVSKKHDFNSASFNHSTEDNSLMYASNGKLYGMTSYNGLSGGDVIYEFNLTTNIGTKKIDFSSSENGAVPLGSLIQGTNGKLYGTTANGGDSSVGVFFEYDLTTNTYIKKHDFDGANGAVPYGSLIQGTNGKLYGTTANGGDSSVGVFFEYDLTTNTYIKKHDFDGVSGAVPLGSLIQGTNGKLYGTTAYGGDSSAGVFFEYDLITSTYSKKHDFGADGVEPWGSLMQGTNGKLYGTTAYGGGGLGYNSAGIIYEYDLINNIFRKTLDFTYPSVNGALPRGGLIEANVLVGVKSVQATTKNIQVSPNPTTGMVTIKLGSVHQDIQVRVLTVTGQLVLEKQYNNQEQLQLELDAPNGTYIIDVQTEKEQVRTLLIKK